MAGRRRRLSALRLVCALALVSGLAVGSVTLGRHVAAGVAEAFGSGPWYAPYVDATLTPTYAFEDERQNPSNDVVLGFVVASRDGKCVPTWGTFYGLDGAASALDLDRRLARMRARGGNVMISFGGAANDELALRCDVPALERAYGDVITRYGPTAIDFDIEGAALGDAGANARRAAAVRMLQAEARSAHRQLSVWLTLPVSPGGLPRTAVDAVDAMLNAHVDLAGVNLLTMDYGASRPAALDLVAAAGRAVDATELQLNRAYRRHGLQLTPESLFHKIGITPMIGQNDVPTERLTLSDAKELVQLARDRHLGRISMWSLNRDTACGAQMDPGTVSNLCSGIAQKPLAFTSIFAEVPGRSATPVPVTTTPLHTQAPDDPAHSPYPIWNDIQTYTAGARVTWHHNVYEAKWWSRANVPDAPVAREWDTPWRLLGPVLPGDHPAPVVKLAPGTYPRWRSHKVYIKGDRVEFDGLGYDAKWWTQGDRPDKADLAPDGSPWEQLSVKPAATTP
jgi:chitinase